MEHKQGNQPGDDPSKFGLKFDSQKPRWELIPMRELLEIVLTPSLFMPNGTHFPIKNLDLKKHNAIDILNEIKSNIATWRAGYDTYAGAPRLLALAAFEMFYLLRGKPYTDEELKQSDNVYRWDLINDKDIESVANIYTMGARKYSDNNWQRVDPDRYYGALMRHLATANTIHKFDSELGCMHAHLVFWNLIALMYMDTEKAIKEQVSEPPEELKRAARMMSGLGKVAVKTKKASKKSRPSRKKAVKKTATKKKKK